MFYVLQMAGKRKQAKESEAGSKKIKAEEKESKIDKKVTKEEDRTSEEDVECEKESKSMRIVSFNVAGLYAACKKNFCENMIKLNPDIICLQGMISHTSLYFYNSLKETKTSLTKPPPPVIAEELKEWKHKRFNNAEKAGYAGTAILSKHKPIAFTVGIGKSKHDTEGRVVTAEVSSNHIISSKLKLFYLSSKSFIS